MGMFEYIAVLTSIILGLGIAHLLQGAAHLIQHPRETRTYWVHLTWAFYLFYEAVFWWWWEFRLEHVGQWTFPLYLFVILYAVCLYLLCAVLFPSSLSGYKDYEEYFYSRRGWFFGIFLAIQLIDVGDTWLKGADYFASLGPGYLVQRITRVLLFGVAIATPNRAFHALLAVGVLLYQLWFAFHLYYTVG
jgi:hypothetical protein